ncbi:MAG TPA: hypothetical protein VHL80_06930 [Polyangia bacterium]|nr:hypothetical protein [Polyangia bacterium]
MHKPKSKSASAKAPAGQASRAKRPRRGPSPAAPGQPEEPRRTPRSDDADAFLPDPSDGGRARSSDDLAEVLAEDFLESATRGNDVYEDELERPLPDEVGGPFVVTDADEELADDVDESNPLDAEPAGRPRAVAGLVQRPRAEEASDEEDGEDEEDDEDDDDDVEDEVDTDRHPGPAR